MKLILAIIKDADNDKVSRKLTEEEFRVTLSPLPEDFYAAVAVL